MVVSRLNSTNVAWEIGTNMPISYDDGEAIGEVCPACCGDNTHFEIAFRFWKCEDCSTVWGVGLNKRYFDPDVYHGTSSETHTEKK